MSEKRQQPEAEAAEHAEAKSAEERQLEEE
jgi:hypothetical protein